MCERENIYLEELQELIEEGLRSLKAYKTNNLSLNNFSNYFQKNLKG